MRGRVKTLSLIDTARLNEYLCDVRIRCDSSDADTALRSAAAQHLRRCSPCLAFRGAVRCGVCLPCLERNAAVMQIVLDRAGPEQRGWYANPVER
jgi:hypothetical protein